jgi:diaminopimelate decarboxylase
MHHFSYILDRLHCEGVSVESLARKHGTPLYVYSQATIHQHFEKLRQALTPLDSLICFAMKSNSNQAILHAVAELGGGFDIVSGGELQRAIAAGGDPRMCVFAGVGKTEAEIEYAVRQGIYCFNAESEPELERINRVAARLRKTAPVAVRVNPDVQARTHAKITTGTYENKFGIPFENVEAVYDRASRLKNLSLRGVQMHIGSQITESQPFEQAVRKIVPLAQSLKKRHGIEFFSLGGGIGIVYDPAIESGDARWWGTSRSRDILTPQTYADRLVPLLKPLKMRILIEPGRFIVGNAGILVARVEYVKHTGRKHFVIVDAAMNDLIRPAFYEAYHEIVPLATRRGPLIASDVVGPICESGDTFCKDRPLPRLEEGDYVAFMSAGAYGSAMSSTYNSRPLVAEAMVNGTQSALVRTRQRIADIWAGEQVPPWMKGKGGKSRRS